MKVAWVNQGARHEESWTAAHGRAHDAVVETLGDMVQPTWIEHVSLGPSTTPLLEALVADGHDLIFATSFGFSTFMQEVAQSAPSVCFEQARGRVQLANLSTYAGAHEEPIFLTGMVGGAMSTTGVIGFVAAVPEPETIRHIDAYILGARQIRPDVQVMVAWVGSWWDPEREGALALALIASGADVLATGCTGVAVGEVATDAGVAWSGHDSDQALYTPETWLTGSVPNWGPYYVRKTRAALEGKWRPEAYYGSMADSFTELATLGRAVTPELRRHIETARSEIESGVRDVFAGPITDTEGSIRVPAGAALSDTERQVMDWYVDGVTLVSE